MLCPLNCDHIRTGRVIYTETCRHEVMKVLCSQLNFSVP